MRPSLSRAVLSVLLVTLVASACTSNPFQSDDTLPTVFISDPSDNATRTTTPFDVTGTAMDDRGVERVELVVDGGAATACDRSGSGFTCTVQNMTTGDHTLTVRAFDAAGNVGQDAVEITFDPNGEGQAPNVVIESPDDGATETSTAFQVSGSVSDDSGVESVHLAASSGFAGPCTHDATNGTFACDLDMLYPGANTLTVYAGDPSANVGQDEITVDYQPSPALTITSPANGTGVAGGNVTVVGSFETMAANVNVEYTLDSGGPQACAVGTARFLCEVGALSGTGHDVDVALRDGGGSVLASDTVTVDSSAEGFEIELDFFDEDYSQDTLDAFDDAVAMWEAILVSDLDDVFHDEGAGESCGMDEPDFTGAIDDLRIFVTSDAQPNSNVLGVAGPCLSRTGSSTDPGTNFLGYMELNSALIGDYAYDRKVETIAHEIGHVLGFGTNWEFDPYVDVRAYVTDPPGGDCVTQDPNTTTTYVAAPRYVGAGGLAAWTGTVSGSGVLDIEDEEGPGTQCGHWDEDVHGAELMTGFLNNGVDNPLSALSIASFADLGLTVDTSGAQPYPSLRAQDHGPGERINEILLTPRVAD